MGEQRIDVAGGKYTFVRKLDDHRIHVLRYGEPWKTLESNAVIALINRCEDLEAVAEAARWVVGSGATDKRMSQLRAALSWLDGDDADRLSVVIGMLRKG